LFGTNQPADCTASKKEKYDEKEVINLILANLPRKLYETETKRIKDMMCEDNTPREVKTCIRAHFQTYVEPKVDEYNKKKAKKNNDVALAMTDGGKTKGYKKFKGVCHHCGKQGHKKVDCHQLKGQGGDGDNKYSKSEFKGKCFVCGKVGH
jgi:hypothetical protein